MTKLSAVGLERSAKRKKKKKESLSISAFKYLRVAMFIWKANIYCTHLHKVRNRVCEHACILTHTHACGAVEGILTSERAGGQRGEKEGIHPSPEVCSVPKDVKMWKSNALWGNYTFKTCFSNLLFCSVLSLFLYLWAIESQLACSHHISLKDCKL